MHHSFIAATFLGIAVCSSTASIAQDAPTPTTTPANDADLLVPLRAAISDVLRDGSMPANDVSTLLNTIQQIDRMIAAGDFAQAAIYANEAAAQNRHAAIRPVLLETAQSLTARQNAVAQPVIEEANQLADTYVALEAMPSADELNRLAAEANRLFQALSRLDSRRSNAGYQTAMAKLPTVAQDVESLRAAQSARQNNDLVAELTALESILQTGARPGRNRSIAAIRHKEVEAALFKQIDEVAAAVAAELPKWPDAQRINELIAPIESISNRPVNSEQIRSKLDRINFAARAWAGAAELEKAGRYSAAIEYLTQRQFDQGRLVGPAEHPLFSESVLNARLADLKIKIKERGDVFPDPRLGEVVKKIDSATTLKELLAADAELEPWVPSYTGRSYGAGFGEGEPVLIELRDLRQQLAPIRLAVEALDRKDLGHFRELFDRIKRSRAKISHRWVDKVSRQWRDVLGEYVAATGVLGDAALDPTQEAGTQLLAAAQTQVDLGAYQKAIEVLNVWKYVLPDTVHNEAVASDLTALNLFIQAMNLEAGGDELEAGRRYRVVLTFSSPRVPVKAAATRLSELSKKHPQLLAEPLPMSPPSSRSRPRPEADAEAD